MLSYLSSWLWGDADDPRIILCKEIALEESEEDNGKEWIWVDVQSQRRTAGEDENLKTILQEYIVILPSPTEETSTETATSQKRSRRRDAYPLRKKRYRGKLKIYSPLQPPCRVRRDFKIGVGSKRSPRVLPYGGIETETTLTVNKEYERPFPFNDINGFDGNGLGGFHFDGEEVPWVDFHADILKIESVSEPVEVVDCSTLALSNTERTSPSDSWYDFSDIGVPINKVSTEGWSILIDSSGEILTSSMIRIWTIRKGFMDNQSRRVVGSLCQRNNVSSGSYNDVFALLDKPVVKRSTRRRKIRRKNELTAKPGHTSLIVEKRTKNTPTINTRHHRNHNTSSHLQATPSFSVSRGLNSLIHGSKDMLLAFRVYLAQLLDTMAFDNNTVQSSGHQTHHYNNPATKAQNAVRVKKSQKKNRRNTLVRWNASQMQRCDKAVNLRRRAMGRGGFNCSVKRSF